MKIPYPHHRSYVLEECRINIVKMLEYISCDVPRVLEECRINIVKMNNFTMGAPYRVLEECRINIVKMQWGLIYLQSWF